MIPTSDDRPAADSLHTIRHADPAAATKRYPTSGGGATAHRNPLSPPVPQLIAALLCALLAFSIVFVLNQKPELIGKELSSDITELVNPALGEYFEGKAIKTGKIKEITENISSRNALLIDLHTGRAICEKRTVIRLHIPHR